MFATAKRIRVRAVALGAAIATVIVVAVSTGEGAEQKENGCDQGWMASLS
jgi:hypothetical protein